MTCSYTCGENCTEKYDFVLKKWQTPLQEKIFIGSKGESLSLDIWPKRKALKRLLQNIDLMLDLLCHKRNPLIRTVVDGRVF